MMGFIIKVKNSEREYIVAAYNKMDARDLFIKSSGMLPENVEVYELERGFMTEVAK